MKHIKQIRFYGDKNEKNFPEGLMIEDLSFGNILKGYGPITQLGIQGRPGTAFYLNSGGENFFPITLGETGIYEIDLENYGQIYSINFFKKSLEDYYDNTGYGLLIDFIFEGDEK